MENHITKRAEQYITTLLTRELTDDYQYHDLPHTLSVRDASLVIGRKYRMGDDELEVLELAALFHDVGFVRQYEQHEDASMDIARAFLQQENYEPAKARQVVDLIDVTRIGTTPKTLMQKILKDADFNTYVRSYRQSAEALRHEWEVFRGQKMTEAEWMESNVNFWSNHEFFTGEAQALFGEEKRKALKKFKKQHETLAKSGKKKAANDLDFSLNNSKSAQMMFKTTLRNQIDLTNIADNKANIMLTINSAIITVGIPLLFRLIGETPYLIYPVSILLLTCLVSIVFATLATRPVKMSGSTDLSQLEKGNTNLFFFGNFFRMPKDEYREGLRKIVENDDLLDKTIVNDMYYLGLSLGRKYSRLHTTYSVFMVGMVLTVLAYLIAYLFLG